MRDVRAAAAGVLRAQTVPVHIQSRLHQDKHAQALRQFVATVAAFEIVLEKTMMDFDNVIETPAVIAGEQQLQVAATALAAALPDTQPPPASAAELFHRLSLAPVFPLATQRLGLDGRSSAASAPDFQDYLSAVVALNQVLRTARPLKVAAARSSHRYVSYELTHLFKAVTVAPTMSAVKAEIEAIFEDVKEAADTPEARLTSEQLDRIGRLGESATSAVTSLSPALLEGLRHMPLF